MGHHFIYLFILLFFKFKFKFKSWHPNYILSEHSTDFEWIHTMHSTAAQAEAEKQVVQPICEQVSAAFEYLDELHHVLKVSLIDLRHHA